ncbi:MAG: hypothetical protein KAY65_04330, partial [Planctomycetes bacterium]|nr:hypothetical protein [Planctomycetota bacterium]
MYRRVLLWALVIGLSAAAARAVPVTVENYSFELPGTDKQANWENVPNWNSDTVAVDSGVETGWGPSDGFWTGFLMGSDPSVWNLTNHVIAPGEQFTLQVDAKINGGASDFFLALYYDDAGTRVEVASDTVALTTSGATAPMVTYSLQFAADNIPGSIGKQIGIELDNPGDGWLGMDNVRLEEVSGDLMLEPRNPNPPDGARKVGITPTLSWTAGDLATSHKIYFGTFEPPTYQLTQA